MESGKRKAESGSEEVELLDLEEQHASLSGCQLFIRHSSGRADLQGTAELSIAAGLSASLELTPQDLRTFAALLEGFARKLDDRLGLGFFGTLKLSHPARMTWFYLSARQTGLGFVQVNPNDPLWLNKFSVERALAELEGCGLLSIDRASQGLMITVHQPPATTENVQRVFDARVPEQGEQLSESAALVWRYLCDQAAGLKPTVFTIDKADLFSDLPLKKWAIEKAIKELEAKELIKARSCPDGLEFQILSHWINGQADRPQMIRPQTIDGGAS